MIATPTTTWRKQIMEEMEAWDESWDNVEATTLSDAELDNEFPDPGGVVPGEFSLPEQPHYTWTAIRVYFLVWAQHFGECYPMTASVPRHPCACEPEIL